jgi:hypothetical protein
MLQRIEVFDHLVGGCRGFAASLFVDQRDPGSAASRKRLGRKPDRKPKAAERRSRCRCRRHRQTPATLSSV